MKIPNWLKASWKALKRALFPHYDRDLQAGLRAEIAAVRNEIKTCAQGRDTSQVEDHLDGITTTDVDPSSYPKCFAEIRVSRLMALAAIPDSSPRNEAPSPKRDAGDTQKGWPQALELRKEQLSSLFRHEIQLAHSASTARFAYEAFLEEGANKSTSDTCLFTIVRGMWERDASAAIEKIEINCLTRVAVVGVLGIYFTQMFLGSFFDYVATILDGMSLSVFMSQSWAVLLSPIFTIPFLCGFNGLIGALLGVAFDDNVLPMSAHWRLARRSGRHARFFAGFLIGVLIGIFTPFVFDYMSGTPGVNPAPTHVEHIATSPGDDTSGALPATDPQEAYPVDATRDLPDHLRFPEKWRAMFLALIFGFSQDAFIRRLQSHVPA